MPWLRFLPALVVGLLIAPAVAAAHPAPFSFVDLRIAAGQVTGTVTVHDFDAAHELGLADPRALVDAAAVGRHGPALADLLARRIRLTVDGRPVAVTLSDATPVPERQAVQFELRAPGAGLRGRLEIDASLFPYDAQHQTFVNVYEDGALRHQAILDVRRSAMAYYVGSWSGVGAVLATFVPAGIHHIVIGPDHILFLVGLILLGGSAARLGLIATAFTIGHSITLSLAVLGTVSPPAWIVEPAIALTVVVVGVDNLLAGQDAGALVPTGRGRRDLRIPM